MDEFNDLEQGGNKIERDLKEIQNTIKYYGKIIQEIKRFLQESSSNTFSPAEKGNESSNPSFYSANYTDLSFKQEIMKHI
jgi:hypothetical protein